MLFNSLEFLGLLLGSLLVYYSPIARSKQVLILVATSLFFYAANQPFLLALLIGSALVTAITSYYSVYAANAGVKKHWAILGVAGNLGVLAFFKYNLLIGEFFLGPISGQESAGAWLLAIPLPVGISFYTFQGISLVVDAFKGSSNGSKRCSSAVDLKPGLFRHCYETLFFISYYPQLVSGPIVKAHDFMPQIGVKRFAVIDWDTVLRSLILGYFLKSVVADNLSDQTSQMIYPFFEAQSSLTLLANLLGYSMQIFADFAGYSLIAIGVAALYGYRLPINFNFPYIATSFSDFWRRWHMSLSSWLREYLYVPLGGNRKGPVRTYVNLFLVMFLGGLWHGAAWSYAIWGTAHGVALAIERFFGHRIGRFLPAPGSLAYWPWLMTKIIGVFCVVSVLWLLFRYPEFSHVIAYFKAIGNNWSAEHHKIMIFVVGFYTVPIALYHAHAWIKENTEYAHRFNANLTFNLNIKTAVYAILVFMIVYNRGVPGEFIYFQF